MAPHSSTLAWQIPWMEEPGGLQSMGSQRQQCIGFNVGAAAAKSLQSCPTLCDPMDCSPPGSSIHGICQARVLEWGAVAFSKVSTLHSQFVPPSPSPTVPTSLFSVSASLFLPCKFCCFESTVLDSQRKPGTGLPGSSRSATGQVPLTSPSLCWRQTNRLNGALP